MLTQPELDAMRETSTSALPDTGTVNRPGVGGALDPVTGVWTPTAATTIYTGECRARPPTTGDEMEIVFGDREVTRQRYIGTFPWDIADIEIDDVVHITVGSDPHIADRTLKVVSVAGGSFLIDRRIGLEVVE